MKPIFLSKQSDLRKWFQKNHDKETELLVGFHKTATGKPTLTWSLDEALCFGWIDGVRRSIDKDSYSIRFTPRKLKSNWSVVNIKKVEELTKQGLMQPAGLAAFSKREPKRSGIYSYENKPVNLDNASKRKFKANKKA